MLKITPKLAQATATLQLSDEALPALVTSSHSLIDQDLTIIHNLPNPPLVTLTPDQIFIRQCKLAGDAVDANGGCFHTEDLQHLLKLTQGAPALIGHNHQMTAVARFFGGEVLKLGETSYIAPKFYWPRAHSAANDLRLQIDTGIIHESSIAFNFEKAMCSICGQDIRSCPHFILETYEDKLCFYWYETITRILEGAFVYRGAEPGTGFIENMTTMNPPQLAVMMTINGEVFTLKKAESP